MNEERDGESLMGMKLVFTWNTRIRRSFGVHLDNRIII